MQTTRQRIIDHLGSARLASAAEIGAALGITPADARHHLGILQAEGVVQVSGQRRGVTQQILPAGMGPTTVWGYGAVSGAGKNPLLIHNAPSLTIEAQWNRPVRVKWINDLKDLSGNFLPHLLPVDPTLHWANPPGGTEGRDTRPTFVETPGPYTGPVPIVTHVPMAPSA